MTVISLYLVFAMLAVIWFDMTRFTIPNWLVGSLLLLYPLAVWLSPVAVAWQSSLLVMISVFAVGYIVFAMKWMGGGDVKLITALSLWVGVAGLLDFVFLFAVLGGLLSLVLWLGRKLLLYIPRINAQTLPRILKNGEPVPYGLAIAGAFLWMLGAGQLAMLSPL